MAKARYKRGDVLDRVEPRGDADHDTFVSSASRPTERKYSAERLRAAGA
jgi:hypothetical protein